MSIRCLKSDGTAACGFVQHLRGSNAFSFCVKLVARGSFWRFLLKHLANDDSVFGVAQTRC